MKLRDHTFLGTTTSLCPDCLETVPAKIIVRHGRVYFRKTCPTHGQRDDFVCSDVREYDRLEFSVPGKLPATFGADVSDGCPKDCGLCAEHEQHTCIGLVELTANCNLKCPMCYAGSGPGQSDVPYDQVVRAIDRLIEVEGGRAEVLQLSGGEPTIHPEFERILDYAVAQPIDLVMLNTNGLTLAKDDSILEAVARHRTRVEVYLQLDGLSARSSRELRAGDFVDDKLLALQRLAERQVRSTLVCTLQPDVNADQIGDLVKFGAEHPWVAGVSFQPATYSGRHTTPEDLERRITFPDVVAAIESQTDGLFTRDDFMPLPCAHPNCHTLSYAYRAHGKLTPLLRFIDARKHVDLLANGIAFTRPRAKELVQEFLVKEGCGAGCSGLQAWLDAVRSAKADGQLDDVATEFFERALREEMTPTDVFRVTITSFLDAHNFDVRRLMKCCIHHVLPSGHVVPFCAYNVLYRNGHITLPELIRATGDEAEADKLVAEKLVQLGTGNQPHSASKG